MNHDNDHDHDHDHDPTVGAPEPVRATPAAGLSCPQCGCELTLPLLLAHADAVQAFEMLLLTGVPMAAKLMQYLSLHAPPKTRLTLPKQAKLLGQLLPDVRRGSIARHGREWAAPPAAWAQAIDQMLLARDLGRLATPVKGHGYLYAVIEGLADKAEGAQERQTEADRRAAAQTPRATVQVRGQAMGLGDALDVVYGGRDPALVALDHSARHAAPMTPAMRARFAALRGGTPTTPPRTQEPRP